MYAHGRHSAQWNKLDAERQVSYDLTWVYNLKQSNSQKQRVRMVVSRHWGGEGNTRTRRSKGTKSWIHKIDDCKFWRLNTRHGDHRQQWESESLGWVPFSAAPQTVAHQAPPSRDSPGGCRFLLQGAFPNQGLNPGLPHFRQIFYWLRHQGSPYREQYCIVYLKFAKRIDMKPNLLNTHRNYVGMMD